MKQRLIETGRITGTHGVRGEVKIQPWADTPELFLKLKQLFLFEDLPSFAIESCRVHKGNVIVKFRGVDDMTAARQYINRTVYLARDDIKLPEGVFFIEDLIGIAVEDADTGMSYGFVSRVFNTGARDVYELADADGARRYMPAVPEVIAEVDIAARRMKIRPMEGLFDAL